METEKREQFQRAELLLGKEAMERLYTSHVAIFGIGGVGGYVAEALARCGVGAFTLIDNDKIALSNMNRQIIATMDTIGRNKTDVMRERILSVNPKAQVEVRNCFFLPENAAEFDFTKYNYVVDAIDTVTAKIQLVLQAGEAGAPIISCMGTGNKLQPQRLEITDLYKTSVCPLAKVMRRELKKRGVKALKVLYSNEEPLIPGAKDKAKVEQETYCGTRAEMARQKEEEVTTEAQMPAPGRRTVPGSVSFVPPAAGLMIAGEVIKDLTDVR